MKEINVANLSLHINTGMQNDSWKHKNIKIHKKLTVWQLCFIAGIWIDLFITI